MAATSIEWATDAWNPVTGCDRVSAGCDHCYAMTLAKRLKAMGQPKYQADGDPRTSGPGFGVTLHPDVLDQPLRWRKPRRVFVNSMSDLFHDQVPDEFIARAWETMASTPQHTYQVLTKRPQRMARWVDGCEHGRPLCSECSPLPNVWLGTSVEDQRYANIRIPHLLATPAAVRWLSIEPLLGPVDLTPWLTPYAHTMALAGVPGAEMPPAFLDWVVIGGESGPSARPMRLEWAESIVDQCRTAGVPVFVKQLGTVTGGKAHHDLATFPAALQVREYPEVAA